MNELNLITTNEQGSTVVSARMLYAFLEVRQQFMDWFKNRIIKYGFQEGRDFVTLTKNLVSDEQEVFHKTMKNSKSANVAENSSSDNFHKTMKDSRRGPVATDYALTLDMAKELAMIERTKKGKEARQYFIDCEKKLHQSALNSPSAIEQTLVQLLAGQQQLLAQLQADVNELKSERRKPSTLPAPRRSIPGKQLALPGLNKPTTFPATNLRALVRSRVDEYCALHGVAQGDTYNYLYKRLLDVYGINAYRLTRLAEESILDVVERYGHLHELYQLVLSDLSNSTAMSNRKLTFETMREEDVRLILTLTFNQGDYLRYAELRAILMEASDYLGLRLAKNRAELFIASALKQGYLIKGWEPGQPFERYRLNLPATH